MATQLTRLTRGGIFVDGELKDAALIGDFTDPQDADYYIADNPVEVRDGEVGYVKTDVEFNEDLHNPEYTEGAVEEVPLDG